MLGLVLCVPTYNYSMEAGSPDVNKAVLKSMSMSKDTYWVDDAIHQGDIESVKVWLESPNLNKGSKSYLNVAIDRANDCLDRKGSDKEIRLQILELLLQHEAGINLVGCYGETALETAAVTPAFPRLKIIDLVLNHGAIIDKKTRSKAAEKANSEAILNLFSSHDSLRERAKTNPDLTLLKEAIKAENFFVIDLILTAKPELQGYLDSILQAPVKFQDLAYNEGLLPTEILMHIDKFVSAGNLKRAIEKYNTYKTYKSS